jgi:hypothetical protein
MRSVTQDNVGSATLTQEASQSTSSISATLQNVAQIASDECTATQSQDPPRAPAAQIAARQDGLPAETTLVPAPDGLVPAPGGLVPAPGDAGPTASFTTMTPTTKLIEKRYTRKEKMRPGLGCTVRYVS